jgi:sugar lactone lactonase YvrE
LLKGRSKGLAPFLTPAREVNANFAYLVLMKRILLTLLALLILYLAFWPVPIDPIAWRPAKNPGFKGKFAVNQRLQTIQHLVKGQCPACEDLAFDAKGRVYAGAEDGRILVFDSSFQQGRVLARTKGRPLGMAADPQGIVYVADAKKGLLKIDSQGQITRLTQFYRTRKLELIDDLVLAPDSSIYFTEASSKFPLDVYKEDLLEGRPNGALFRYDLKNGKVSLILDSLHFANGVAISNDGTYVLVSDMGRYRILRHYIYGSKKGKTEVFAENLPGFPDGVNTDSNGTVWLSIVSPRTAALDGMMPRPFLRKLLMRLPKAVQPAPQRYACILGFAPDGRLTYNLQDPLGGFAAITNCVPFKNKLYLGSLLERSIGVIKKP